MSTATYMADDGEQRLALMDQQLRFLQRLGGDVGTFGDRVLAAREAARRGDQAAVAEILAGLTGDPPNVQPVDPGKGSFPAPAPEASVESPAGIDHPGPTDRPETAAPEPCAVEAPAPPPAPAESCPAEVTELHERVAEHERRLAVLASQNAALRADLSLIVERIAVPPPRDPALAELPLLLAEVRTRLARPPPEPVADPAISRLAEELATLRARLADTPTMTALSAVHDQLAALRATPAAPAEDPALTALAQEVDRLRGTVAALPPVAAPAADAGMSSLVDEVEHLRHGLAELRDAVAALPPVSEQTAAPAEDPAVAVLAQEVDHLRRGLAELRDAVAGLTPVADPAADVAELRRTLAALRAELERIAVRPEPDPALAELPALVAMVRDRLARPEPAADPRLPEVAERVERLAREAVERAAALRPEIDAAIVAALEVHQLTDLVPRLDGILAGFISRLGEQQGMLTGSLVRAVARRSAAGR